MQLAAFAPKAEPDVRAHHLNMSVSQGRQSEGAVLLPILLIADADSGLFEQPDDRRQHFLARHVGPFQVAVGMLADLWQGCGEGEHPVVLDSIPDFAPALVIPVLLATAARPLAPFGYLIGVHIRPMRYDIVTISCLEGPRPPKEVNNLTSLIWTIVVVLVVLWLLGWSFHVAGGLIFLLLVLAIAGV